MKSGEVQIQLSDTNLWWHTERWERDDLDLQAAAASGLTYRARSLDRLVEGGLYVLRGPRRVGKSTS